MSDILLKNILVDEVLKDITISGGLIKSILPAGSLHPEPSSEVVDCSGMAAIPGFFNMHTHAAMSLMRGVGEGQRELSSWLQEVWKVEARIDPEFCYHASRVACLEMIKTGTTTFNDMYFYPETTVRAALEMGIRPAVCYCVLDLNDEEKAAREKDGTEKAYEQLKDAGCIFSASIHSIYTVSEKMILWTSDFARRHGLKLHIHLCETRTEVEDCKEAHGGLTPVEYLDRLGVLDQNVTAAHSLWLSDSDVEILGKRHVTCVHNINSNAKLGSGFRFRFEELRDAGANICLGTDGCASSNNLDMLEAVKNTLLFQTAWRQDKNTVTPKDALDAVTVNGARFFGLNTGRIEEGAVADISIVDLGSSFFLSNATVLSNLVWSAHSDCIDSVIASGRFVMRHRKVEGEEEILSLARRQLDKIRV